MARLPLQHVRRLPLRVIALRWAEETNEDPEVILLELRRGVLNIPRLRGGQDLLADLPPNEQLPDPETEVDHDWLREFCDKQHWPLPDFWFGRAEVPQRFPGRPGYPHRPALEAELRRRGEDGELIDTLAGEMRRLQEWAQEQFRDDQAPTTKTLRNSYRELYNELRRMAQN